MACGINIKNLGSLSVYEFAEFPGKKFDEDVVEAFRKNKISGSIIQLMSEEKIISLVTYERFMYLYLYSIHINHINHMSKLLLHYITGIYKNILDKFFCNDELRSSLQ